MDFFEVQRKYQESLGMKGNEYSVSQYFWNEAITIAAEIAEQMYDKTYWDDPSAGIAAEIRRLIVI